MIKNRKSFFLMIAFVVITGAIMTLVSTKIKENTKQERDISEVKNNGSNVKIYKNSELNFEIDYSDSLDPKEGERDFFGDVYDYNLLLKKYDFFDLYLTVFLNIFIRTDKNSIETCNESYVRTSKYVGEETGDDVSGYKLPKTQNINGETFYSEWDYEGDMMSTYEKISYKKLYNNKCYQLAISLFYSSYPAKSDIIEDKDKYDKIIKDRKEKGGELVKEFEKIIKGFRFTEKETDVNKSLISAIKEKNLKEVRLVIKNGRDVNKLENGALPLVVAIEVNNIDIVKELISAGAKIDTCDDFGTAPLAYAAYEKNWEMVKELIKAGADVNYYGKILYGETALMYAVSDNNIEMVKELIKAGADVNKKINFGFTALNGIDDKKIEVMKELIRNGADVNITNGTGEDGSFSTLLIEQVLKKNIEVVKELIKSNVRINEKDSKNKTALDYAKEKGYFDIVNILKDAGAKE
jgi:ankyrin repeat protein